MSRYRQHTTARITYRFDGATVFSVPYDREWIAAVKGSVPADSRDWDPRAREWSIWPPYGATVIQLTREMFPGTVGPDSGRGGRPNSNTPPADEVSDAFVALHLRETAPPELVDSAYRCLAKLAHPDRGGTHEQMLTLTAAHDALKARVAS
jgi:hypothetical protein